MTSDLQPTRHVIRRKLLASVSDTFGYVVSMNSNVIHMFGNHVDRVDTLDGHEIKPEPGSR